jgi:hypothetical protein
MGKGRIRILSRIRNFTSDYCIGIREALKYAELDPDPQYTAIKYSFALPGRGRMTLRSPEALHTFILI